MWNRPSLLFGERVHSRCTAEFIAFVLRYIVYMWCIGGYMGVCKFW